MESLEHILKKITPADTPPFLYTRISQTLEQERQLHPHFPWIFTGLSASLASAIVVMLLSINHPIHQPQPEIIGYSISENYYLYGE